MTDIERQEILHALEKNKIFNLSIIGFINENKLSNFIRGGKSFLVQGDTEEKWVYFSSDNENEFSELINNPDLDTGHFGALDDWMIPHITKNRETDWLIKAYQFHFPQEKEIPANKIETEPLAVSDSGYIISQSMYSDMLSVEYLNERIRKSVNAGIYADGKLVAWGLTHDDGSLGSLHVLEGYRGNGYAKEISISLIKQCRKIGKIPFLQCETKNIPAQNLVKSLGYVQDRNVSWLKVK